MTTYPILARERWDPLRLSFICVSFSAALIFLVPAFGFPHAAMHGDDRGLFEPLMRREDFAAADVGENLKVEDLFHPGDEFENAEQASALGLDRGDAGDKIALVLDRQALWSTLLTQF